MTLVRNRCRKVLILGTLPPPVGGVSIHVKRLVELLEKHNIVFSFLSLKSSFCFIFFRIFTHQIIHLHCSNVYFRCLLAFFCFLLRKKLWITYHGNLGRYNRWKNSLDYLSVYFVDIPIVLNEHSFWLARKWNGKVKWISSFLPPQQEEQLSMTLLGQLHELRSTYKLLCSTNVSAVAFDDRQQEIYGIVALLDLFETRKSDCLLVSDSSGNYKDYILTIRKKIPKNVVFIAENHSYYALLKEVDCMIRNTLTDGDALSVKEALFLKKYVCATDVVSRHYAVNTYHTLQELGELLDKYRETEYLLEHLSAEQELLNLYQNIG